MFVKRVAAVTVGTVVVVEREKATAAVWFPLVHAVMVPDNKQICHVD